MLGVKFVEGWCPDLEFNNFIFCDIQGLYIQGIINAENDLDLPGYFPCVFPIFFSYVSLWSATILICTHAETHDFLGGYIGF